tara:strand:+ start:600 stop:1091 length:492 start_codon:yes stop_codon:yes gene_type:complete
MPALSKKQQRFFGIVRAIQKGEMAPTTPETAKAAADMKKKDVKDFASTKHKGLPEKKVSKEEKDFSQKDKIMKKVKSLHKHLYKNLHKGDKSGDVNEGFKTDILTDKRYAKRIADQEKANKERDARMKYGKFYNKAKEARDRLRPGEVKRYDKKLGRYVSNKE